jgi:hypothetical protein
VAIEEMAVWISTTMSVPENHRKIRALGPGDHLTKDWVPCGGRCRILIKESIRECRCEEFENQDAQRSLPKAWNILPSFVPTLKDRSRLICLFSPIGV